MKHTKLITALVVLLAAGLGTACDKALPTDNWREDLTGNGGGTPGTPSYIGGLHPYRGAPPPCPPGTPPRLPRNCVPQIPSGPPGE